MRPKTLISAEAMQEVSYVATLSNSLNDDSLITHISHCSGHIPVILVPYTCWLNSVLNEVHCTKNVSQIHPVCCYNIYDDLMKI